MGKFYIHIQDSSVQHLISKDKRLANVIYQIEDLECLEHKDPFSFIVREIVEQMLSLKAARAIYARLIDLCDGQVTINNIKKLSIENLRSIGISYSKSQYVLNFVQAVENGQFVDGDFWHAKGHQEHPGEQIGSNQKYWKKKLKRNVERDREVNDELTDMGWIVLRFWESDVKKNLQKCVDTVCEYCGR